MMKLQIYSSKSDFYEIAMTEHGEPVLLGIAESDENSLTIQLLYTDTTKFYRSTLLGSFVNDQMVIGDIKVLYKPSYSPKLTKPFRRGYGTLLMNQALEIAKQRGIKKVTGNMVSFDEEERKRQINFYTKCGFTIDSQNQLLKIL
ncbi:GNAT family N-acetyltransferase [Planococcus halocryophilus]|nr:GNAT family N-acetyltransferase [Planococcus halocryophilus]